MLPIDDNEIPESELIYIDVESVDKVADGLRKGIMNHVKEAAEEYEIELSLQQLYALTEICYYRGNITEIFSENGERITKNFAEVYKEGLEQFEANSWEHNRYVWENWWSLKQYGDKRWYDAAFETYVKGTFIFNASSAPATRITSDGTCYMFFTQEELIKVKKYEGGNYTDYELAKITSKRTTRDDIATEEAIFSYEKGYILQKSAVGIVTSDFTDYPDGIRLISNGIHYFPEYPQSMKVGEQCLLYATKSYGGYADKTLTTSGCGTFSMSCIVSGLLETAEVNPITYVDNLDFEGLSYYSYGQGSTLEVCNNDFLEKYYGLHSYITDSEAEMLSMFESLGGNCAALGGEKGHYFAIIPIIDDPDGYKFWVIDSAFGYTGKYKSGEDFYVTARANGFDMVDPFLVCAVIYP